MSAPEPWRPVREALRTHGLTLPEAHQDSPWGEAVLKVRKKIFLFLGADDGDHPPGFGVKLGSSLDHALAVPGCAPMGYGLGKFGWVSVSLQADLPPVDVLLDWVEESYRLVAPKRLGALLDAGS